MPSYRHNVIPGATYFFTVTLANRNGALLTTHIDLLRDAFRYTRERHPFDIDAIVVLPEHLHTIWTLPANEADYATRWRLIKSHFSRSLPPAETLNASRSGKGERGIWQRRFWEHTIRDEADYARHVDYIHFNPVKHGHAQRVAEWEHSSFHRYVKRGILPGDWGGDMRVEGGKFGEWGE